MNARAAVVVELIFRALMARAAGLSFPSHAKLQKNMEDALHPLLLRVIIGNDAEGESAVPRSPESMPLV